jgi:hypothetical protein
MCASGLQEIHKSSQRKCIIQLYKATGYCMLYNSFMSQMTAAGFRLTHNDLHRILTPHIANIIFDFFYDTFLGLTCNFW